MSDILKLAHETAKDLHKVGAMDDITMRMMDQLCLPDIKKFSPGDIKAIREQSRMSQAVFAALLNVNRNTVAQWEQGKRSPGGPSARMLDIIERKGIEAIV